MKHALTKKIGLVLLLPLVGSLVGLFVLDLFLSKTRVYFHSLGVSSQQSMLAAELPDLAHEIALGQGEHRFELRSRVEEFEHALVVLQRGGTTSEAHAASRGTVLATAREGSQPTVECQPCHTHRGASIGPAPSAVQPDIALVASLWNESRQDLLTVAEAPREESRFVEAYRRLEGRLPELVKHSRQVVMSVAAEYRRQYDSLIWALALIAAASGVVFLASLFLVRRYVARDLADRNQAEVDLGRLNQRNELILRSTAEGILGLDLQGNHTFVNPAAARMLGYDVEELVGRQSHSIWHHAKPDGTPYPEEECPVYAAYRDGTVHRILNDVFWRKDGTSFPVEYASTPIYEKGRLMGAVLTFEDITERKQAEAERTKLEEQFRAAQKMEAIGTLTGGIAHDFNNLLFVILGYTEFALEGVPEGSPLRENLLEVQKAGERAEALTRQLLVFSRRQILQPRPIGLNQVLTGIEKMLRRVIREDIDLKQVLAPDLGLTLADPGQIEQVIMNLVVNARDAMSAGGKLTIETANVELDAEYAARHVGVKPGPYIRLTVTDTGCGMDEQTLARIFEPFFTTKEYGRGTGLGLSTVYGIVKQAGGNIWVYSEPGRGTTFKIYLPRELLAVASDYRPPVVVKPAMGTETILVVEDEEEVRDVIKRILGAAGYNVLTASNGSEALLTCEKHGAAIHLVLTDVVMPKMNGRELGERLALLRPGLKILYMSGYADNAVFHHGVLESGVKFISKPFNASDITRKVREVIDGEGHEKNR